MKSTFIRKLNPFYLNLTMPFYNFFDFIKVASRYYKNKIFMKIDLTLFLRYAFYNPFAIKQKEGKRDIYGETPLETMALIAKNCKISSKDHFLDLGCGRGRICFWVHAFFKSKVTGIDYTKEFIDIANAVVKKYHLKNIEFFNDNFFNLNFQEATIIYLYGSTLESLEIAKLIETFDKLPSGIKIITVSYPLSDFTSSNNYELLNCFRANFPWGETEVFIQIKK